VTETQKHGSKAGRRLKAILAIYAMLALTAGVRLFHKCDKGHVKYHSLVCKRNIDATAVVEPAFSLPARLEEFAVLLAEGPLRPAQRETAPTAARGPPLSR